MKRVIFHWFSKPKIYEKILPLIIFKFYALISRKLQKHSEIHSLLSASLKYTFSHTR